MKLKKKNNSPPKRKVRLLYLALSTSRIEVACLLGLLVFIHNLFLI